MVISRSDGVWDVMKRVCSDPHLVCTRSRSLDEVARDVPFDVVILDCDDVKSELRARFPKAFIVVTSQDLKPPSGEAVDYVLLKPLNSAVVQRMLEDLRAKRA